MPAAHPLTDHEEIRAWAEERDAKPACVRGTGRQKGDTGMIRLDFPGYSGAEKLQEISWRDWFRSFDQNNLALLVQDSTARGQRSNFNKLVARRPASARTSATRSAAVRGVSADSSHAKPRSKPASRARKTTNTRTRRTSSARKR